MTFLAPTTQKVQRRKTYRNLIFSYQTGHYKKGLITQISFNKQSFLQLTSQSEIDISLMEQCKRR